MKSSQKFAIALMAGVTLSVFAGKGSSAQSVPPTYFIVDFSEITDPEGFKALAAKATPEILAGFGGKYVVRSQNVTAVEGVAPQAVCHHCVRHAGACESLGGAAGPEGDSREDDEVAFVHRPGPGAALIPADPSPALARPRAAPPRPTGRKRRFI